MKPLYKKQNHAAQLFVGIAALVLLLQWVGGLVSFLTFVGGLAVAVSAVVLPLIVWERQHTKHRLEIDRLCEMRKTSFPASALWRIGLIES